MNFIKARKIINVALDKILEDRLWQKWLVEQPENTSFEEYKNKIFELARLKNRTKEEKEQEMRKAFEISKKAIELLDPFNDLKDQRKRKKVSLKKRK